VSSFFSKEIGLCTRNRRQDYVATSSKSMADSRVSGIDLSGSMNRHNYNEHTTKEDNSALLITPCNKDI
jgi:hypothetical protein